MTEWEMAMSCKEYFTQNTEYDVFCEIPFLTRSIDMVLRNKSNTLFTIEFKLHDWRRAIRQAMDHSLGADKAYICLPKRKNNHYENIISEIIKYNIGLMIYDENSSQKVTILKDVDKSSHIEVYKNLLLEECDIIK